MKPKIYIDGKEGTTGLQIYERLGGRDDIELLLIDEDKRKDIEERRKFLNAADIAFLCLPDAAAREAVSLIENDTTRVIDASTAHRTDPDWDYGFAELSHAHRAAIKSRGASRTRLSRERLYLVRISARRETASSGGHGADLRVADRVLGRRQEDDRGVSGREPRSAARF